MFVSNDYTNPSTNLKTLTTLTLTLTDPHKAFESFCAPVSCFFVWNYSCTVDGVIVNVCMYINTVDMYINTVDMYVYISCYGST